MSTYSNIWKLLYNISKTMYFVWMNACNSMQEIAQIQVNNNIVFTCCRVFSDKTNPNRLLLCSCMTHGLNCVGLSMWNRHHSQSAWPQTGRAHMDKGSSHSGSAAVSRCLSRMGSPFGWPPWTTSSLYTPSQSRPLTKQSETHRCPILACFVFLLFFYQNEGQNQHFTETGNLLKSMLYTVICQSIS